MLPDKLAPVVLMMALPACAMTGAGREPATGAQAMLLQQGSVDTLRAALAQLAAAKIQYRRMTETYRVLVAAIVGNDDLAGEHACQVDVPVNEWPVDAQDPASNVRRRGLGLLEQELPHGRCQGK